MGETTSGWNVPLHSSDSEHRWMKRYNSKGKGGAFRIDRGGRAHIPQATAGDPANGATFPAGNASSVLTNPFDKHSS